MIQDWHPLCWNYTGGKKDEIGYPTISKDIFRVHPRHILSHAQIPHVFLISQKRPDSVFNYHKPSPHVYITVKSP